MKTQGLSPLAGFCGLTFSKKNSFYSGGDDMTTFIGVVLWVIVGALVGFVAGIFCTVTLIGTLNEKTFNEFRNDLDNASRFRK